MREELDEVEEGEVEELLECVADDWLECEEGGVLLALDFEELLECVADDWLDSEELLEWPRDDELLECPWDELLELDDSGIAKTPRSRGKPATTASANSRLGWEFVKEILCEFSFLAAGTETFSVDASLP